ncbi:MAG: AbrB/MazE/SpoVT family DNA-binding domain-containing protein [Syntrophales bacterium]
MRVTSKGQVTIPQLIREQMGFLPDTEIEFCVNEGRVYLRKLEEKRNRGRRMVERMRGRATTSMSTDEIMALMRGTGDGHPR